MLNTNLLEQANNLKTELINNFKDCSFNNSLKHANLKHLYTTNDKIKVYSNESKTLLIKIADNLKARDYLFNEINLTIKDKQTLNSHLNLSLVEFELDDNLITISEYLTPVNAKEFKQKYSNQFSFKDFVKTVEYFQDYHINYSKYSLYKNTPYYSNKLLTIYDQYQVDSSIFNLNELTEEFMSYLYNLETWIIGSYRINQIDFNQNFRINSKGELKIIHYGKIN